MQDFVWKPVITRRNSHSIKTNTCFSTHGVETQCKNWNKITVPEHHLNHLHMLLGCLFQVEVLATEIIIFPSFHITIRSAPSINISNKKFYYLKLCHENIVQLNKLWIIHITKTKCCHLSKSRNIILLKIMYVFTYTWERMAILAH